MAHYRGVAKDLLDNISLRLNSLPGNVAGTARRNLARETCPFCGRTAAGQTGAGPMPSSFNSNLVLSAKINAGPQSLAKSPMESTAGRTGTSSFVPWALRSNPGVRSLFL